MYNKSEIMKNAWNTYRNSFLCRIYKIETFADALKYAWAQAKSAISATKRTGWVKPSELATGDTIKVANLWGLKSDKVIASIEPSSLGFAGMTIRFNDGSLEVFADHTVVQRVAVA